MNKPLILQNIPCTLVTGFLGSGKTTVINQLLSTKPANKRWALLINEFGRIGIDGALLTSATEDKIKKEPSTIAIREVSGGCICCTSQLPLQIALTRLLSDHRPQRLIIEPTGLAHPHELLRQLSAPHWQTALRMQAVITVLNAKQWQQKKYRTHDGFQAHISAADVVVINRYEQLSNACKQDLQQWIAALNGHASIIWAAVGSGTAPDSSNMVEPLTAYSTELTTQLNKPSHTASRQSIENTIQTVISLTPPNRLMPSSPTMTDDQSKNDPLPYRYHDQQLGMQVGGWRLPASWIFDADRLQEWLLTLPNWQRVKGIVHTSDGWQKLNFTPDSLSINTTSAQIDSRLEIILDTNDVDDTGRKQDNWAAWDAALMALILD